MSPKAQRSTMLKNACVYENTVSLEHKDKKSGPNLKKKKRIAPTFAFLTVFSSFLNHFCEKQT
jgi:hypothetical protein